MPARSGHFVILFYFDNSSTAHDPYLVILCMRVRTHSSVTDVFLTVFCNADVGNAVLKIHPNNLTCTPQVCGKSPEFWTTSGDKGEEIDCFPVSLFQCVVIDGFHQVFSTSLRGTPFSLTFVYKGGFCFYS